MSKIKQKFQAFKENTWVKKILKFLATCVVFLATLIAGISFVEYVVVPATTYYFGATAGGVVAMAFVLMLCFGPAIWLDQRAEERAKGFSLSDAVRMAEERAEEFVLGRNPNPNPAT